MGKTLKSFTTPMCCMPLAPESVAATGETSLSGVYTRESNTSPLEKLCDGSTTAVSVLVSEKLGST